MAYTLEKEGGYSAENMQKDSSKIRKKLTNIDAAWLHMDSATNFMMIVGMIRFDEALDWEKFKVVLQTKLVEKYDRFSQRVIHKRFRGAWWIEADFELDDHMTRLEMVESDFQPFMSSMMSSALPQDRPLWHVSVVYFDHGGSAIVVRIHHAMGDGITLSRVLLSLTESIVEKETGVNKKQGFEKVGRGAQDEKDSNKKRLPPIDRRTIPQHLLMLPTYVWDAVVVIHKLVFSWPDPKSVFNGRLSERKQVTWSEPLDLAEVKAVGKALGGTINDVMMTILSGALREFMLTEQVRVRGMRAVVPFNLRPFEKEIRLGNHFGLLIVPMPVERNHPQERFKRMKKVMDRIKVSAEPIVAYGLLQVIGFVPAWLEQLVLRWVSTKVTCALTNVPGPRQPIYMAGSKVTDLLFWAPVTGQLGLGVSILSYNGRIKVGVSCDQNLVDDINHVLDGLDESFDELKRLAERSHP